MRGRGSFKVLVTGLVMGGVLLSQGCFLGWLKEKTACSHCHKCPNSTGKQHDKNSAGEAENKGDGYASREVYSVEVEPSKGGRPMVKFGAASNTEIKLTLCNPKLLTTEGVKDKVMAMIGQMVPRGLNFNDFPQQQVKMLLEDLVKIECLRRTEIKGLLEQEEFRKKLAQKVEVDLNALVFEHVINQVKDKVIISDEEVAEEYRENLGKYIKELGGVRLVAAKYSTLEEAQQELAALMDKGVSTIPDFTEEI